MDYNPTKFEELVLYIAKRSERDDNFGMTKLNKILYYADMMAYARRRRPITGARYQKLPHGPAARATLPAVDELKRSERAAIQVQEHLSYRRNRVIALKPPNMDLFSGAEVAIVDEVIDWLWDENGAEVSRRSHREMGWQLANIGEDIPYEVYLIDSEPPELSQELVDWIDGALA